MTDKNSEGEQDGSICFSGIRLEAVPEQAACLGGSLPERKIREYAALLAGPEKASDKFFALGKKIEKDQRQLYVVLRDSRSCMYMNILALLERKVITPEDLDGFSEQLREIASHVYKQ